MPLAATVEKADMSVIAIDWSGTRQPAGKLWIAEANGGCLRRLQSLPTREEATSQVIQHLRRDSKAIVGLDFAFSMPAWFLRWHRLLSAFDLWAMAAREGEQWLEECEPPFWGRPGKRRPDLETHYRRTEQEVQRIKGITPKSCFQIGGAGAVGTGSVRGMPCLTRIREAGFNVWPFDPPTLPMVIEIYPRILTGAVVKNSPNGRADYVKRYWPRLPATLAAVVGDSEDAFDAAVSALVMDRHRGELEGLVAADEVGQLEGEIWVPASGPPNQPIETYAKGPRGSSA